jgi:carbon dioxide concentrating mechanism protein CcmM
LIGIDSKAKRRILESIIQRPNGAIIAAPSHSSSQSFAAATPGSSSSSSYSGGTATATRLSPEVMDHLRQLLAGGYKISAEHVDQRRFRTGSWQSCGQIEARSDRDAAAALEGFISEYQGEYVRLIGIDAKAKRRVLELIIQRP